VLNDVGVRRELCRRGKIIETTGTPRGLLRPPAARSAIVICAAPGALGQPMNNRTHDTNKRHRSRACGTRGTPEPSNRLSSSGWTRCKPHPAALLHSATGGSDHPGDRFLPEVQGRQWRGVARFRCLRGRTFHPSFVLVHRLVGTLENSRRRIARLPGREADRCIHLNLARP
jgi:hypothetical protein